MCFSDFLISQGIEVCFKRYGIAPWSKVRVVATGQLKLFADAIAKKVYYYARRESHVSRLRVTKDWIDMRVSPTVELYFFSRF